MPPFSETSQGTAGFSQIVDLATRQSNGRRCRLWPIVTVPPSMLMSGTPPLNSARYSPVSEASTPIVDLGGALDELEPAERSRRRAGP